MIRVLPTADALAGAAAALFVRRAAEAVRERGRFAVALAGGGTPRPLYERLAAPPLRDAVDWSRTHLFWGDERCVPPDDPRSNARMVRETLLAGAPVPADQVHPVPCDDPPAAAAAYEEVLRAFAGGGVPRLDLVLLGLGGDGHTASLFPGEPALDATTRLAVPAQGPPDGPRRVSLTLTVLDAAAAVVFLVSGSAKAAAVARVLGPGSGAGDPLPAARVRPRDGALVWLLDAAAAADLPADLPAG